MYNSFLIYLLFVEKLFFVSLSYVVHYATTNFTCQYFFIFFLIKSITYIGNATTPALKKAHKKTL